MHVLLQFYPHIIRVNPMSPSLNRQQQSLRDEIRALHKDNAELKSSLAQMRKSNVQVANAFILNNLIEIP